MYVHSLSMVPIHYYFHFCVDAGTYAELRSPTNEKPLPSFDRGVTLGFGLTARSNYAAGTHVAFALS